MPQPLETVRSMRANAARLREIAVVETQLSAQLLQLAKEIDEEAARLEKSGDHVPAHAR